MHLFPYMCPRPASSPLHLSLLLSAAAAPPPTTCTRPSPIRATPSPQATDFAYAALDADRGTQLLLGACIDRSGAECVAVHGLDVESGILVRGRVGRQQSAGSYVVWGGVHGGGG